MRLRFETLDLTFKDDAVVIRFSPQLTFIHGQVATGKSSIARIVDWCLGASMDYTPALDDELVSAALSLSVGPNAVRIVRNRTDTNHVRISWQQEGQGPHNEVVPLRGSGGEDADPRSPETLSDYLFVLAGTTPLRVPKNRRGDDATLQRLSFRDFMAFCYLEQETLNSSLMRFGIPIQGRKSEDVMRAMLGLYSEHQQRLQAESDGLLRESNALAAEAKQASAFLDRLGIDDDDEIDRDLTVAERARNEAQATRRKLALEQLPATHPTTRMRARLRALDRELDQRRDALDGLASRISRDRKLRAELITAQMKLNRASAAVEVLAGVSYSHCPQCGNATAPPPIRDACGLCHQSRTAPNPVFPPEATEADLESRIDELAEAVDRHDRAQAREQRKLREHEGARQELDNELTDAVRNYESARMAGAREVERRLATAVGDLKRLRSAAKLRSEVRRLQEESARLVGARKPVLEKLRAENERLATQERFRDDIADAFRDALVSVGMPDISPDDRIVITDKLVPRVEPASGTASYGFENLGSSGLKTLFQCCYALALHRVAAEHELLLPRFLIVDTPTQHVDERVDSELFHGFFRYLFRLLKGPMREVQVVVIESEFEAPLEGIVLERRKLLRNDPEFPRLVPYYRSAAEPS